jgi:hypothetical protein
MALKVVIRYIFFTVLATVSTGILAQERVPLGIHYQAVARDNYGNELINRKISVKFSIISGDPLGTTVFQELHQDIYTSKFGVFSLIIGHGVSTGGASCTTLSQVAWETASHFLKVEVKFDNDFMDMGTMQFLAVPYALYAQRSLEPGPEGPKGDQGPKGEPGNPASDNQTLSFDGSNLTISSTNSTVNMTNLLQNLEVSNDGTGGYNLALTRGNTINLATIEKDGDPTNEIQDLVISDDKIKISKNTSATEWPLTKYLDNTDSQALTYDAANRIIGISGNAGTINLSELKNDADFSVTNEIQDLQVNSNILTITGKSGATPIDLNKYLDDTDNQNLTYNESANSLSIDGGNSVTLGSMVAFRAKKTISETVTSYMTDYDFITGAPIYNDGNAFEYTTGEFTAPVAGIYTFDVSYTASGGAESRALKIFLNGSLFEILNSGITPGSSITRSITMKLAAGNKVKLMINVGTGFETGTGAFSGSKVN